MASLTPDQSGLFDTLVEALHTADDYPTPDLALAVHFGEEQAPSANPTINRLGERVRHSVLLLHSENPEGFRQAVEAAGEAVVFRVNAILGQCGKKSGEVVSDHA
ncbi:MAG: hypothetical protein PHN33_02750 [Candidatus Peribacteraceae bacterium]|nr:hypothetical protein [Candidatus Peribacteraceae bacterium]